MGKRKAKELENGVAIGGPRRSSRRIESVQDGGGVESKSMATSDTIGEKGKKATTEKKNVPNGVNGDDIKDTGTKPLSKPTKATATEPPPSGRQYWLMKAEPESRLEKGHDIKFSIDDLAAKTEPEPWDGIRSYPARNNLRAMKKGDLAFFYHSSCKVPAIVGVMEIVAEHSPDLSAHDPSAPYHDASSTPDNPKWSVVHVAFRQKLATPLTLKELREFQAAKGGALENMQMLKLGRLSVSKVSEGEWAFLTGKMGERGDVVEL